MKTLQKLLALLLVVSLVFVFTACGQQEGETSDNPANESNGDVPHLLLGISMADASDANMQIVVDCMESLLPEFEAQYDCTAELIVTNASYSVDTQLSDVESLIEQGCSAISIRSVDTTTDAAFVACQNAGIPVMDTWFGTQTENYDARLFVLDNYYIGELEAQWCIDYVKANPDAAPLNVCYLDGISGAADTLRRCEAFYDVIEAEYGNAEDAPIKILDSKVTENNTQTAMQLVEDWMQSYPEMNCIIGYGDDCAMAAVNALKSAGKSMEDYIILGVDGNNWLSEVPENIDATVKMNFEQMARFEMEILFKLSFGEDASGYDKADKSNVFIVDASNYQDYL